ncbi:hypothetical protein [Saccharothrix xinjiangensis]|uniref:Uncharacterized protein n=1 Tax=Saccharothrix xinjiangensis TaxID=204798 RepID=A0ABV9Y7H1_9PSEU
MIDVLATALTVVALVAAVWSLLLAVFDHPITLRTKPTLGDRLALATRSDPGRLLIVAHALSSTSRSGFDRDRFFVPLAPPVLDLPRPRRTDRGTS